MNWILDNQTQVTLENQETILTGQVILGNFGIPLFCDCSFMFYLLQLVCYSQLKKAIIVVFMVKERMTIAFLCEDLVKDISFHLLLFPFH